MNVVYQWVVVLFGVCYPGDMETHHFVNTLRPTADFAGMLGYYMNLTLYHQPISDGDDAYDIAMRAYTPVETYVERSIHHLSKFTESLTAGLNDRFLSCMNTTVIQHFALDSASGDEEQVVEVGLLLTPEYQGYHTEQIDHLNMAGGAIMIMLWLFQADRGIDVLRNAYTTVSAAVPNLLNVVYEDDAERFVYHFAWVLLLLQSTQDATHAVRHDAPFSWREPLIIDDLIHRVQDIPAFFDIVDQVKAFVESGVS